MFSAIPDVMFLYDSMSCSLLTVVSYSSDAQPVCHLMVSGVLRIFIGN
jgi:hypothetical protein